MPLTRRTLFRAGSALPAAALLARYPGARLVRAQGTTYDLIDLGAFADAVTDQYDNPQAGTVSGLTEEGMAFGRVVASPEKFSPATWSPAGKLTRIKSGTYGGAVRGANAAGVLVGVEYRGPASQQRPVLWRDGEKAVLPYPSEFPEFFEGVAEAINDDGVAIGHAFHNYNNTVPDSPPSTLPVALRWNSDGVEILERPAEATSSYASAINPSGVIAGTVTVGELRQLAVWDGDELELYPLPEELTEVFSFGVQAITVPGLVVASGLADGGYFAAVYDDGEPTLLSALTEDSFAYASDMNADGVVVGASVSTGEDARSVATLWVDGEPRDLNEAVPSGSGMRLGFAVGINSAGAIAATGLDDEDVVHGVLLLPAS